MTAVDIGILKAKGTQRITTCFSVHDINIFLFNVYIDKMMDFLYCTEISFIYPKVD